MDDTGRKIPGKRGSGRTVEDNILINPLHEPVNRYHVAM
jgi:hypothetical protein